MGLSRTAAWRTGKSRDTHPGGPALSPGTPTGGLASA